MTTQLLAATAQRITPFWEQPQFIVTALMVGGAIFVITLFLVTVARFYRRCGADEALVRTGAGGNKVVIGGGVTVFPILHQLLRVSLRSLKLSVDRSGHMALVTRDKIRANVTTELYIKVEPLADDVMAAARSFGESNLDEHSIGDLIEGKLTDALRSVSANSSFMELHTNRKDFAESIQKVLSEELKKNGLTLENVSITGLAMVPVKDLNASDFFDSEGLMTITEQVKANARKTNQIERETEVAIQDQNVTARKKALELDETQKRIEADQSRRVQEYAATQAATMAKAVYEQQREQETAALMKQQLVETARIEQQKALEIAEAQRVSATREAQIASEKAQQAAGIAKEREIEAAQIEKMKTVEAAEIEKQKTLEAATIEKQKTIETARIAKQIAVTQATEIEARAEALKAQAEADRQQATQGIITVEATAKARREKDIAVIKSEEAAQQSRIAAEREAFSRRLDAETTAAALKAQADGEAAAKRSAAEGDVARAEGNAKAQQLTAEAAASVVRTEAQAEADRVKITAEARAKAAQLEAEALIALAEATRKKGEAEADARQKIVEAENQMSTKFLLRDVSLKALEVLPMVTRELMTPAKAISEIKILQMNGTAGQNTNADGTSSGGAFGSASPVLRSVLEAGAAFPLLRELMQFAQVDTNKMADSARKMLGAIPEELKRVVADDPELAAKLAAMSGDSAENITVREAEPQG